MPSTLPTATEFKARHPRFLAVSDDTVTALLEEAGRVVGDAWAPGDWRDAVMLLCAHMALEEGHVSSPVGIKSAKAGDVQTEFDLPGGRMSGDLGATYGATTYGRRYLAIAGRYAAGAALVV